MKNEVVLGNVMVDCDDGKKLQNICPVWPEEAGKQQKQMHFDFQVDNLSEMVKKAESLGATKAKAQFGGNDFVTMLDPSGHPFCLCL